MGKFLALARAAGSALLHAPNELARGATKGAEGGLGAANCLLGHIALSQGPGPKQVAWPCKLGLVLRPMRDRELGAGPVGARAWAQGVMTPSMPQPWQWQR